MRATRWKLATMSFFPQSYKGLPNNTIAQKLLIFEPWDATQSTSVRNKPSVKFFECMLLNEMEIYESEVFTLHGSSR